jgi:hypothetical protein
VAALAGVAPDDVRQTGDSLQGIEKRATEEAAARITAGGVMSEGSKLVRLAERASKLVRLGGEGVFHLAYSPLLLPTQVIILRERGYYIAQMGDLFLVIFE